jgi:hypothetical protein
MKRLILVFLIMGIVSAIWAENWKREASVAFTMSQQSYSDNWNGVETGSISWIFNANFLAEKEINNLINNKNSLKIAFGQTHNQVFDNENNNKKWESPKKSTDLIDLKSRLRFKLGKYVDPFCSLQLESHFIDESGEDNEIFNPNTITEAFGLARIWQKDIHKELSTTLGAAFKQYVDANLEDTTNDGGVELITEYKAPLLKKIIDFNSSLNLYQPLYYSESDDMENDDWKSVRMDWQNDIDVKLHSLISIKFYIQVIYNKLEDVNMQIQETLGIGISYKLL